MKIEEIAYALIDAFCGGGASLWGRQLSCDPGRIVQCGSQLKGLSTNVTQRSWGVGASCTTMKNSYSGEAAQSAVVTYTQQTNAMDLVTQGLQSLADKAKGVSEFINKAQTYLRSLLDRFRIKIMKLLGSWWGMLVVTAVAFLAAKLIKALINKIASKLGAAGNVLRALGDRLANEVKTTLTNKPAQLPDIKAPQKVAAPMSTAIPGGDVKWQPTFTPEPVPPAPPARPANNSLDAKPLNSPTIFTNPNT